MCGKSNSVAGLILALCRAHISVRSKLETAATMAVLRARFRAG